MVALPVVRREDVDLVDARVDEVGHEQVDEPAGGGQEGNPRPKGGGLAFGKGVKRRAARGTGRGPAVVQAHVHACARLGRGQGGTRFVAAHVSSTSTVTVGTERGWTVQTVHKQAGRWHAR